MDINEQIYRYVGHCLLNGLKLGFSKVQLAFDEVESPFFSCFEKSFSITGHVSTYWSMASQTIEKSSWLFWPDRRQFTQNVNQYWFLKLHEDSRIPNHNSDLRNQVARIAIPHTTHGANHSAWFGGIHEQSGCKRPHPVLGCPWARSAIWREWKHRHWEESKTSKRGQC